MTATADRLLDDLPPYYAGEPLVQRSYQAIANELDRLFATIEAIRVGLTPTTANDDYKGLSMLEAQTRLPVAPAGQTEAQRRVTLLAYLSARRSGRAAAWVALLDLALGTTPWEYEIGPADYQITIKIGYAADSFTAGQIVQLARAITPAHYDIIVGFDEGFLVGISEVGIESL